MTRYLVTMPDGREFRFVTAERAAIFTARNPGAINHGAQPVPLAAMPPVLAAAIARANGREG